MSDDIKARLREVGAYAPASADEICRVALARIEALEDQLAAVQHIRATERGLTEARAIKAEAQLAATREALRGCKLHLADARSGFIPGCISDQTWEAKRDDLVAEADVSLGKDTQ